MDIGRVEPGTNLLAAVANTVLSPQERAEQQKLIPAIRALNETEFFGPSNELQLSYDRSARRHVVKLVDVKTREVVQQIPPEYVLRLAEEASGS